jgi:hypothetical protein
MIRSLTVAARCGVAIAGIALLAQLPDPERLAAKLELVTEPSMPVRVYFFKNQQPFRLSPVQAIMPLRVDLFYRERLWRSGQPVETLEVTCNEQSHFLVVRGRATYDLPAGRYRVEAYRGLFYRPATEEFELKAGETRRVTLRMEDWSGGRSREWLSGDDHIHLVRTRQDDEVFLGWLEAEDLSVGNFLQLQRQMDAAPQYGFGRAAEARRSGYSIRSGHESRCEYYGHINLLGGREIVRPLSIGTMYANREEAYPFPAVLFDRGRKVGATVGYAHFHGSMPHSTLLLDLALGNIDFLEVFQFGVLRTAEWYELLNAGLKATGIAGSDFPVPLNRVKQWPRWIPLLGPERTLVKARAGESAYEAWADGVKKGNVVVTNGPLVEVKVDEAASTVTAEAQFWRSLEKLEIVRNGEVVAATPGDGRRTTLTASARLDGSESAWVAARVVSRKEEGEPDIQGHTNPVYVLRGGRPVMVRAARGAVAAKWEKELAYYRSANLPFRSDAERQEFFDKAEKAMEELKRPLQ